MCKENDYSFDRDRFNAYYGLEEHLKSFRDIPLYEKLCCSWEVDKQRYINNISVSVQRFPHYSDHGESHSKAIIANIEFVLGKKRIKQLSVADTWLLLQCAYAHDIGMSISAKDLISQMAEDKDIYEKVKAICQKEESAREAFEFIQPLFEYYRYKKKEDCPDDDSDEYLAKTSISQRLDAKAQYDIFSSNDFARWPIKLINAFTIILENYVRPRHGEFSENILSEDFAQICDNGIVPIRLRYLVARISSFHMKDREFLLEEFPKETLGICKDYMNPRFAAIMLRLGDLLDLDNGRFNQSQLNILGDSPYVTLIHQFKHEAVTHFLVTPLEISIKANFTKKTAEALIRLGNTSDTVCEIDDRAKMQLCMKSCKSLHEWLEMLREELDFLAINWLNIVPRKFEGSCPNFVEPELRIDGRIINKHELGLSYQITTKRSAEIIEGSSLYQEPQYTFIREILQNALDATKLKMFRDIMSGFYPEFYDNTGKPNPEMIKKLTPACFAEKIKDNIDFYRIEYDIKPDEKNKTVTVSIRDYGVGITYNDLTGMLKIGNSNKTEFNSEYEKMPNWLKPTGSFGIGLQSIFYVAKSFKILSRPYFEPELAKPPLREMVFHSARMGGEIEVSICNKQDAEKFGYGTEVQIVIDFNNSTDKLLLYINNEEEKNIFDIFCESMEQLCVGFINYLQDVYSDFIIPCVKKETAVTVKQKKCEKLPEKAVIKKNLLNKTFGSFCILNEYGTIKRFSDDFSHGFSCWNGKYGILIKYKPNGDVTGNRSNVVLYYKGIKINGDRMKKLIHIPFFDAEIHIFSEFASAILQINREDFLIEKVSEIASNIHKTHFCCLQFIFNRDNLNLYKEELESIWIFNADSQKTAYMILSKSYLALLMFFISNKDKTDIALKNWFITSNETIYNDKLVLYDKISYYVMYNNFLRYRTIDKKNEYILFNKLLIDNLENLYFIANKALPPNDLSLQYCKTFEEDFAVHILEDYFYNYSQFAAYQFKILMVTGWSEPVIVYKICRRNGGIVRSEDEDFWTLCVQLYKSALRKNKSAIKKQQFRLVFPSKAEFEKVSVSKLTQGIEHEEITKFNSFIISPLSLYELEMLVNACAGKKDNINSVLNKYFSENWLDRNHSLVEYINKYRISQRNSRSCSAQETDCETYLEYKRFLKTFLGKLLD
ncbi:MAG: ATP-binding protein [Clostridia bacterium]|nr:ATP-binding protein [Clostridia bacterium]